MAQIQNSTYTTNALRYWWNGYPRFVATFQHAIDYYKNQGTFYESFGSVVRTVSQTKVQAGMEKLAKKYKTSYPPKEEFFQYLADEAGSLNSEDVQEIAINTAKDIGSAVKIGVGGAFIVLLLVGGLLLYQYGGGKLSHGSTK